MIGKSATNVRGQLLRLVASSANRCFEELARKLGDCGWHRAQRQVNTLAHQCILTFLRFTYRQLIDDYRTTTPTASDVSDARLAWVVWWQGESEAPELVRMCLASLRRNLHDVQVRVVDSQNYHKYASVSDTVLARLQAGQLSVAQFSDILRTAILRRHGGLWIDASMLTLRPVHASVFEVPFYTRKTQPNWHYAIVSDRRWMVGLIGGARQNRVFAFVNDMLEAYWSTHRAPLHYFHMDYLLAIAYKENIAGFRTLVDRLPDNNPDAYEMRQLLGEPFDPDVLEQLREGDTDFFTLDRRFVPRAPAAGQPTYYEVLKADLLGRDEVAAK